jgi:glycosyltransferase involved in cell wall biosynthesis
MKSADALVSPRVKGNVSELQYPHKLSEYLASGRAVIATDVSDQKLILAKADCGFVAASSKEGLASAIREFAALSYERRNQLGKNAIEFAKTNLSFSIFKNRIQACYKSLL